MLLKFKILSDEITGVPSSKPAYSKNPSLNILTVRGTACMKFFPYRLAHFSLAKKKNSRT
jgi:hypothetical protein